MPIIPMYLNILDENGKKTGKIKISTEVHKNGDWHKASHIWIINAKSELFIWKRSQNVSTSRGF